MGLHLHVLDASGLGQLHFTLSTTPMSSVINSHQLRHHETIHIFIYPCLHHMPIVPYSIVDYCPDDISHWMTDSKLKPNADKTKVLVTGTHRQREKVTMCFYTRTW